MVTLDPNTKVSEITVADLIELITAYDKAKFKDKRLTDLTVEQFAELVASAQETKSYLAAQREQEVTARIFKDVEGVIAAGTSPFRLKTAQEVDQWAAQMKEALARGGEGEFVVAMALVQKKQYTSLAFAR